MFKHYTRDPHDGAGHREQDHNRKRGSIFALLHSARARRAATVFEFAHQPKGKNMIDKSHLRSTMLALTEAELAQAHKTYERLYPPRGSTVRSR